MGFEVRLVPLMYVKPFVKRHKNDVADALRGYLAEHEVVVPQGIANVVRLAAAVDDPDSPPPELVRDLGRILLKSSSGVRPPLDERKRKLAAVGDAVIAENSARANSRRDRI